MSDFIYLMLNKPFGYVCSTCSDRRHTIYELLKKENCINWGLSPQTNRGLSPLSFEGIHPVGRLDAETTGLILLTNDGMFNHNLTIPENHISKTYFVTLERSVPLDQQKLYTQKAKDGLLLPPEKKADEYFAKDAEIVWKDEISCNITIQEGKFHQVRRTFLALENKVETLERISIGDLTLPEALGPGQFSILSSDELALLKI